MFDDHEVGVDNETEEVSEMRTESKPRAAAGDCKVGRSSYLCSPRSDMERLISDVLHMIGHVFEVAINFFTKSGNVLSTARYRGSMLM